MTSLIGRLYKVYTRINPWFDQFPGPFLQKILPRRLRSPSSSGAPNLRAQRLNSLLKILEQPRRYLEVGLQRGFTFEQIEAGEKWGVDPEIGFQLAGLPENIKIFQETSDTFFGHLDGETQFDLVYLDGLHTWEQTYVDLQNALNHLTAGGVILVDDVYPTSLESSLPDEREARKLLRKQGIRAASWYGDVFKLIIIVNEVHPELDYVTFSSSDHCQTAIWRKTPAVSYPGTISHAGREIASQASFRGVFVDGQPKVLFRCKTDDEALGRIRQAVRL